jgi:uroporphyrinogen-III decarboxylase
VVGVDWRVPLDEAARRVGPGRALQGNLDPAVLFASQEAVRAKTDEVLDVAAGLEGHVFNLGHGVPMTHFGVGTAELLGAMSEAVAGHGVPAVVGVDWRTSLTDAAGRVQRGTALQGNLDPVVLLAGRPVVERAVRAVVEDGRRAVDAGAVGHVFNLGHGVLPATDPDVITEAVALVHEL